MYNKYIQYLKIILFYYKDSKNGLLRYIFTVAEIEQKITKEKFFHPSKEQKLLKL